MKKQEDTNKEQNKQVEDTIDELLKQAQEHILNSTPAISISMFQTAAMHNSPPASITPKTKSTDAGIIHSAVVPSIPEDSALNRK